MRGGAGLLAYYAIAAPKQRGIKVIANAKPADAELVRGYGGDIAVERGPGFAEAIRRELPNEGKIGIPGPERTAVADLGAWQP